LPDHIARRSALACALASGLLIALIALSWNGMLDQQAQDNTATTLKRALATYAIARGLNGVISVAQGTEIAIQPIGVGLTITAGEILDPLNDLVERFSWLVLVACGSLGTQLLMSELLANEWVSALMTLSLGVCLVTLWWPRSFALRSAALRAATLMVFARFVFAAVTLVSSWVDQAVLAERQAEAIIHISEARDNIQQLRTDPTDNGEASILQRFSEALNLESQLLALGNRVEQAIEDLLRLMVLFLVQTIIIPVTGLIIAYATGKWLWRLGGSTSA
jgi:hypothetical protein